MAEQTIPFTTKHATQLDKLDQFGSNLDRLTEIVIRFDEKSDRTDERLHRIEVKCDQVEVKLDRIEARLDEHDARFENIDARFDKMDSKNTTSFNFVLDTLHKLGLKQDQLDRKIDFVIEYKNDHEQRIRRLESRRD